MTAPRQVTSYKVLLRPWGRYQVVAFTANGACWLKLESWVTYDDADAVGSQSLHHDMDDLMWDDWTIVPDDVTHS